jgi:hypothetical protein
VIEKTIYRLAEKKSVVRREVEIIGKIFGEDKCPACEEAVNYIEPKVKDKDNIVLKKTQVTDEIAEKEKIDSIPLIKDCTYYKSETGKESKKCKEVSGFEEEDWSDL